MRFLRVASYNIHSCVGPDRRHAPDRILEVMHEIQADVLGLQEVDTRHSLQDGRHQFDYLAQESGLHAAAGANVKFHRGDFGNAVLSRWPIGRIHRHDISVDSREPRGVLDVEIQAENTPLRFVVTHFGLSARERRRQADKLKPMLKPSIEVAERQPCLLAGDFNHWGLACHSPLKDIERAFSATFSGASYPAVFPLFRLDRIYVRPTPVVADARIHRSAKSRRASDHLPVVVDIAFDV